MAMQCSTLLLRNGDARHPLPRHKNILPNPILYRHIPPVPHAILVSYTLSTLQYEIHAILWSTPQLGTCPEYLIFVPCPDRDLLLSVCPFTAESRLVYNIQSIRLFRNEHILYTHTKSLYHSISSKLSLESPYHNRQPNNIHA